MNCPVNPDSELITISVDGVSIERCRKCNGHWLDHGELAKLAAREESVEPIVKTTRKSSRYCPVDASPLTEVEFPEHSGLRIEQPDRVNAPLEKALEHGASLPCEATGGTSTFVPFAGCDSRMIHRAM